MEISLEIINIELIKIRTLSKLKVSQTNSVETKILSANKSNNAPDCDVRFFFLAMYPSK